MRYLERLNPLEKLDEIIPRVRPINEIVEIPAWDALGYVLAEDVIMPHDYPPKPRAAYDGYAVNSEETPGEFRIAGRIFVGERVEVARRPGEAYYVSVGAFLPDGADAVVPEEAARREGDKVVVDRKYEKFDNVDPPGSYARRGTVLLERGTVVTIFDVVALLDVGITKVRAYRKLRGVVIATGSELIEPPVDPDYAAESVLAGKVIESTATLIAWYMDRFIPYARVVSKYVVGDDTEEVRKLVSSAVEENDFVLITGGAGPGEADHFYKLGIPGLRGFKMKPGRPTSVALIDGKLVVGLSGYPISALHGIVRVVEPILAKMANAKPHSYGWSYAVLERDVRGEMAQFLRVKLEYRGGDMLAIPTGTKHHSFTDAGASGIALIPPGGAKRGDKIPVLLYRDIRPLLTEKVKNNGLINT